jgi:hypothetical protein
MTEATLSLCKHYIAACAKVRATQTLTHALLAAVHVVQLRKQLAAIFARQFGTVELEQHCQQLIEAYEKLAA